MTAISSLKQATLDQAEQFAYSVLGRPNETQGSAPNVVHHYHHNSGWLYSPSRSYCCSTRDCCPKPSSGGKKDDSAAAIIALAAIVILATSYYVGADWALSSKAAHQQDDLTDKKFCLLEAGEPEGSKVHEVLQIEEQMAGSMRSEAKTGLLTKTALIASAIAVGAGAGFAAPALLTAAAVTGAVTSGVMLMRKGYIDSDTAVKEQALQLLDTIEVARRA